MIKFPCRCGHNLEVPDDQAGLPIQCPRCGLLCDVPNVSDLNSLETDGSYKIDNPQVAPDPSVLPELQRTFTRDKRDENGNEVDLRGPVLGIPAAGFAPGDDAPPSLPSDPFAEPVPDVPRYDPETGELIVPLGVTPEPQPVVPPTMKLPVATAAEPQEKRGRVSIIAEPSPEGWGILLAMFRPMNVLVSVLYAIMIALEITMLMVVAGFLLSASVVVPTTGMRVLLPLVAFALVAAAGSQLANTVEETGPLECDEIPRLLRNVNLFEDLLNPAFRVVIALLAAYGPWVAWLIFLRTPLGGRLMDAAQTLGDWLLFGTGTFFFPALLLVLCTSSTLRNLRPDRVAGTVQKTGTSYILPLLLWTAVALTPLMVRLVIPLLQPLFAWPFLLVTVPLYLSYVVHALGWSLGSLYRRYEEQFPWVMQRHERTTPRRAFQVLPAQRRRPATTPAVPRPREIR